MATITRPAIEISQGNLKFFLTYITPADLHIPNFYSVDKLDVAENQGFQRVLEEQRAKDLADDLVEAFPKGYANLPTTVFLATDGTIDFDAKNGQITIDTEVVCPLSVVDGQHRIEGLKLSKTNEPGLSDFQMPATIAVGIDDTHQMFHFFVVNTNQKPVDAGLAQQITARFTKMNGLEELPYLPKKLRNAVGKGFDELAVDLVGFLNTQEGSPLKGRIQMANEKKEKRHRIAQTSFVNTLKRHVFHPSNDMYAKERTRPGSRMNTIMLNYFRAVDELLVEQSHRDDTRLYNNNGIYFLCQISKWTFQHIYNSPDADFTVPSIRSVILGAFGGLETDYLGVGQKDWWLPSPTAPALNRGTADAFADAYLRGLQASSEGGEEEKAI